MGTEASLMMAAFGAAAMTTIAGCVTCWAVVFIRMLLGLGLLPESLQGAAKQLLEPLRISAPLPLVPWRERRPAPWAIIDLVGIVLIYLAASLAVGLVLRHWVGLPAGTDMEKLTLSQRQLLTAANIVVTFFSLAIGLALVMLRTGAGPRDLGWWMRSIVADAKLGLIGFVMLAPPVYVLQGVLVYFWKPSKHPLMEMFKGTPDVLFFAILVAAAVAIAPLVEEMLFRVLLQGCLEKLVTFRRVTPLMFLGGAAPDPTAAATYQPQPLVAPVVAPHLSDSNANPYELPASSAEASPAVVRAADAGQPELRGWQAWLPIGISSVIFALLHYSHGPDWIPLTFLAAGMGYLYQRTHSVVPGLMVHLLLNGASMWMLWIYVFELKSTG